MQAGERFARIRGFTYVWALAAIAVLGVALAAVGTVWSSATQREREEELIRVGTAYAEAIASYWRHAPGSVRNLPPDLAALVRDDRYIKAYRHLRDLHPDPMDPSRPWGLVTDASGRIIGVYSQSSAQPLRRVPTAVGSVQLPAANRYSDWKFVPKELQQ
jgi:type II secretory pathway pseudopilin PulG